MPDVQNTVFWRILEPMEVSQVLQQMALVAGLAVVTASLVARVRLPIIAGLLLAGAIAGPHGAGLLTDLHTLEMLAEVGVVLLLFTIGLEFSMDRMRRIVRLVALGGGLQVALTTAIVFAIALALGETPARATFWGFAIALSSTAIVFQMLSSRGEMDSPHGKFIVGALIFQDLCVVPMGLMVPVLAGKVDGNPFLAMGWAVVKATILVMAVLAIARWVLPRLFARVDATRSREVFLMAVVGICAGTAWLTSLAGLSLALGAFLAGLVLADTEYQHRALGDTMSLRNVMTTLFFISMGTFLNPSTLVERPWLVFGILAFILVGKGFIAAIAAMAMKFPARVAWLAGAGLAQFGEFGFVLVGLGRASGLVTTQDVEPLLAAGVISMFLTPLIVAAAPHMSAGQKLLRPLERLLGARGIDEVTAATEGLSDHVVVAGFGIAGRVLVNALREAGIAYVVLELNADTVRSCQARGEPVFYADVTSPEALMHARLDRARALVMTINDPDALRRGLGAARRIAGSVPILVRTRYFSERQALMTLGATEVVTEEVEAGIEMLVRVLARVGIPREHMLQHLQEARRRTIPGSRDEVDSSNPMGAFPELESLRVETFLVRAGSHALGKTVLDLELRKATGALMLGARRGGGRVEGLDADAPLADGDTIYLVGPEESLFRAQRLLESGEVESF
jgi:CPA2 family monovalent cation:H+ antiporter-2